MATDHGVVPNDLISSFFWPTGSTEGITYEQLKQRRAVAAALASRARPYPGTIGQGIASLGEKLGDAMYERRTDEYERMQREADRKAREEAVGSPGTGAPAPASAGRPSAYADPDLTGIPASAVAELPPEISAGRSAIAERALRGPQLASAYTGTASDAGSPGLTYAGPGGSSAEPPDRAPPDQSIAQGRDGLARTMLAQAAGKPAGAPAAPYGSPVRPPAATAPVARPEGPPAYPGPGESYINPPQEPGVRQPRPTIGVDTPAMARIKRVLNTNDLMSAPQRAALQAQYDRMKEARDEQDKQVMTEWNRTDADWLARRKEYEENKRKLPDQQREQTKALAEEVTRRRWGTADNEKAVQEATRESAKTAKQLSDSLPRLNEAIRLLNSRATIHGAGATSTLSIPIPGAQNLEIPGALSAEKVLGQYGVQGAAERARNTEYLTGVLYPLVGAMLRMTTGTAQVSNKDVEGAIKATGIDANLELGAQLAIVNKVREDAVRMIQEHNAKTRSVFNDPRYDDQTLKQNLVPIQFDPEDIKEMTRFGRGAPRPQEVSIFERRYGPGSAARALRGERE